MENIKLVDVNAKRRSGRKRTAWIASVLLAGSLVLSGCAAVDSAASAVTATATSSAVATPESTGAVADVSAGTTAQTIADTTSAAEAFMATLSAEQVEQLTYAYDDETKSTSWSNFPVTFVERAGLNLTDLTEVQRAAALKVLEALLSDEGYTTVTGIMNGDQYLLDNSSSTEDSLGQ